MVFDFEFAFDFDVREPVSRRSAERQAAIVITSRALQGTREAGGEVAEGLFAYFWALQKVGCTASEAGGATPLIFKNNACYQ